MTLRKLKFKPSVHAIERFREFFGVKEIHAVDFANDLMQSSVFVMTQPDGRRIYKNESRDTMVVVSGDNKTVITILPSQDKRKEVAEPTEAPAPVIEVTPVRNPILVAASATIQRELTKAGRQFTREYRVLTEEIAVIGLEIAQLSLNKARARSPITQRHITDKVSEVHARQTQLAEQRKQLEAEYSAIKSEAQEFISEAVVN